MPVYDQNYRPWKGKLNPRPKTWYVIARTHIRLMWKKGVIALLVLGGLPFLVRAMQIMVMTRVADVGQVGSLFSDLVKSLEINGRFFLDFLLGQWFVFVLMIVLTGAGLIASDRRCKATPLYFSKPVSFFDYVLGKFLVICWFGGLITAVPALILFLMRMLLAEDTGFFREFYRMPFVILGFGLLAFLVLGGLMLALSAMVQKRSAGILFFATLWLPDSLRAILKGVPEIGLLSMGANIKQVGAWMFGVDPPYGFSPLTALIVMVLFSGACFGILRWRVRPSEVVT